MPLSILDPLTRTALFLFLLLSSAIRCRRPLHGHSAALLSMHSPFAVLVESKFVGEMDMTLNFPKPSYLSPTMTPRDYREIGANTASVISRLDKIYDFKTYVVT
jgi:hypothetical protein